MISMHKKHHTPRQDLAIIALSVMVAALLYRSGIIHDIVVSSSELKLFGSFIAGFFFTSVFTVSVAAVAFAEILETNSIVWVALFGAMGAVLGDLIIFRFVKNNLADDLQDLITKQQKDRLAHIFHTRIFRFLTPFLGGLIIASPLPDEIGITMMGLSKINTSWFIPVSFVFNFLGIVAIGIVVKSIF